MNNSQQCVDADYTAATLPDVQIQAKSLFADLAAINERLLTLRNAICGDTPIPIVKTGNPAITELDTVMRSVQSSRGLASDFSGLLDSLENCLLPCANTQTASVSTECYSQN